MIARVAVIGISGSDVRDMMLAGVERRFGADRAPHPIEHQSDNGNCHATKDVRDSTRAVGLAPSFTPVRSPKGNGIAEAFVKALRRDYIRLTSLPDAATVLGLVAGRIGDHSTVHPHSASTMRSPTGFRAALNPAYSLGETGAPQ